MNINRNPFFMTYVRYEPAFSGGSGGDSWRRLSFFFIKNKKTSHAHIFEKSSVLNQNFTHSNFLYYYIHTGA